MTDLWAELARRINRAPSPPRALTKRHPRSRPMHDTHLTHTLVSQMIVSALPITSSYRHFAITVTLIGTRPDRWVVEHMGEWLTANDEWGPREDAVVFADGDDAMTAAARVAPDVWVNNVRAGDLTPTMQWEPGA